MNRSAFLELIQQVSNISDQQTEELEKVAATFPYCQTAHLLLAKSAHDKGSMLSAQRLRRASAYATDRQLLKRLIYTSATPLPTFDEAVTQPQAPEQPEAVSMEALPEDAMPALTQDEETAQPTDAESFVAFDESDNSTEQASEEITPVVQLGVRTPSEPEVEMEAPEAGPAAPSSEDAVNSELAFLLTINSLSSSFTDLLAQKPDIEEVTDEPELNLPVTKAEEQAEHSLSASPEATEAQAATELFDYEKAAPAESAYSLPDPADAAVNYSLDEIDTLYQEDALGYWMSSSRMGEVLQIKDEVTRQRPAAFHPELILEYSKTHELTAPAQPSTAALGAQFDIIDQFLKINPKLKAMNSIKLRSEPQEDLSLKSSKIKKGLASESLANIFLQQGKVKKALKIYEQLILKYPEKKSYFAEQIEKLQNIT